MGEPHPNITKVNRLVPFEFKPGYVVITDQGPAAFEFTELCLDFPSLYMSLPWEHSSHH